MMTASEYRARADTLDASAERCASEPLRRELQAMAQEWRRLADSATWQEQMLTALAASGVTPDTTWPDDA